MGIGIVRRLESSEAIPGRAWLRLAVFLETQHRRGTLLDVRDWAVRTASRRGIDVETIRKAMDLSKGHVEDITKGKARKERREKSAKIRLTGPGALRRGRAAVRKAASRSRQWAARHQAIADEGPTA